MSREAPAPFSERLGVRFPRPAHRPIQVPRERWRCRDYAFDVPCCIANRRLLQNPPERRCNVAHYPRQPAGAEAIGVETYTKHEVDAIPRHKNSEKAQYRRSNESEYHEPSCKPRVQHRYVEEQRGERPDLLGVPAPKTPPRVVGPAMCSARFFVE